MFIVVLPRMVTVPFGLVEEMPLIVIFLNTSLVVEFMLTVADKLYVCMLPMPHSNLVELSCAHVYEVPSIFTTVCGEEQ